MRVITAAVFYLYAAFSVVPMATLCLLACPVTSARVRYEVFARRWIKGVLWVLKVVCGVRYRVKGIENIPSADTPVVVLANHQSAWETLFLPAFLPQRVSFVYKQSLHWIPFFGWALKSMGMIAINRKKGQRAYDIFLKKGKHFLEDGWWVALFPQGTRVAPGARGRYKTGGARFAEITNTPVLPVALNSGVLWPRNAFAKKQGVITVSFGPVIDPRGKSFHQINELTENWIEGELEVIARATDEA